MLLAVAALLAEFGVILVHRRRSAARARPHPPLRYTAVSLAALAAGWAVIGTPDITWTGGVLMLLTGVLIGVEAADATVRLGKPEWAGPAVAAVAGAASATWLLSEPLPYL